MAYAFGTGTLTIGATEVGTVSDVSIEVTSSTIPLYGASQFPVALATGHKSVKGKAKSGEIDSSVITAVLGSTTISNDPMAAAATGVTLTWTTPGAGTPPTFALANVVFTKFSVQGGGDKWAVTDIEFEAWAAADGDVLTITGS